MNNMEKKKQDLRSARPEKRIVLSIIGWIIELIIDSVRKRKEAKAE